MSVPTPAAGGPPAVAFTAESASEKLHELLADAGEDVTQEPAGQWACSPIGGGDGFVIRLSEEDGRLFLVGQLRVVSFDPSRTALEVALRQFRHP